MAEVTACSTLAFSLSDLETAIQHISAYGFTRLEISDQVTHSKHFPIDTARPREIRRLCSKYGITPIAANVSLAVFRSEYPDYKRVDVEKQSSAETKEIKEAKRDLVYHNLSDRHQTVDYVLRSITLIEKAHIAGIPMVGLQGGRRSQISKLENDLWAAAEVVDRIAEWAKTKKVKIILEMPHVWDIYYSVDNAKVMLSRLRTDNVGVCIDSTHWHTSGYDLDSYLRFLGPKLWHVHLRDAAGRDRPGAVYELEKTPGKGDIDFGIMGECLDKYGYRGDVSLETEYKNYTDPAQVDLENRFALRHLENVGWKVPEAR